MSCSRNDYPKDAQSQSQSSSDEKSAIESTLKLPVENVTLYAVYMLDPNGIVITWNTGAAPRQGI